MSQLSLIRLRAIRLASANCPIAKTHRTTGLTTTRPQAHRQGRDDADWSRLVEAFGPGLILLEETAHDQPAGSRNDTWHRYGAKKVLERSYAHREGIMTLGLVEFHDRKGASSTEIPVPSLNR